MSTVSLPGVPRYYPPSARVRLSSPQPKRLASQAQFLWIHIQARIKRLSQQHALCFLWCHSLQLLILQILTRPSRRPHSTPRQNRFTMHESMYEGLTHEFIKVLLFRHDASFPLLSVRDLPPISSPHKASSLRRTPQPHPQPHFPQAPTPRSLSA